MESITVMVQKEVADRMQTGPGNKDYGALSLACLLYTSITIPIVALFFCFNTLPLIKGVIYSFTNFKGYGSYDSVSYTHLQ